MKYLIMLNTHLQELMHLLEAIKQDGNFITGLEHIIKLLKECFLKGARVLIAGNGGSAASAQHFAAEIVVRYRRERKAYGAQALTTDTSILTAEGNDHNFNTIFSRQVEAYGRKGDIFIGLSTSGNSENIIQAVQKAREIGIKTICFLGHNGGRLKDVSDISLVVPSNTTSRIQEVHDLVIHIICEEIEKFL